MNNETDTDKTNIEPAAPVERLVSGLRSDEARLAVQLKAWIDWREPPASLEEEAARQHADAEIASLAFKLQEDVSRVLLTIVNARFGH